MARWQFPDAFAEVERLRVELEQARKDAMREHENTVFWNREAQRLQAERDDLAARLQSIQQSERTYTAAKLTEAAKMRKGEAL